MPDSLCASDAATIRAARLLDGRGGALAGAVVAVRGGIIASVGACDGEVTHEFGDATILPGIIDVHVHLDWHFGAAGRFGERPGEKPATTAERQTAVFTNARLTLEAGFTTVQSLGSPTDVALREAIARGAVPGPRVLTSAGQIDPGGDPLRDIRSVERVLFVMKGGRVYHPDATTGARALNRQVH